MTTQGQLGKGKGEPQVYAVLDLFHRLDADF